ncbi:MAG: hypothetical protein BGN99_16345 [Alphaproteobacteria bacterium 65-37]|nr:MAG: hypothetical protein BGN99_16345 [Alphaproteobacteria bacterium 65-37]
MVLADAGLLGEGAGSVFGGPGEHTIAHAEPFDVGADRYHFPRELVAEHEGQLWPQDGPKLSLSKLEVHGIEPRSVHLDEDVARTQHRRRNIREACAFGTAIVFQHICAHERPFSGLGPASHEAR